MSDSNIIDIRSRGKIVPVVLPASGNLSLSGRIRNIEVFGSPSTDWLVSDGEGDFAIAPKYAKQGFRLLRDVYEEEEDMDGWRTYQKYLADWQAGKTTSSFPLDMLPKLVQDRQAGQSDEGKADPWARPRVAPTTGATTDGSPKAPKGK